METKKLGFGCMRLPLLDENDQTSFDVTQLNQMVDRFIEEGFTYFDTAYMYHDFKSEIAMKEALVKRHARNTYTLASKLPLGFLKKEGDQERIFDEQLEKTGAGYFDYYLLHNITISGYRTVNQFDSFGFIEKKKAEGKIKHIGFSFHDTADLLDQVLTEHPEAEFVQLQLNYLDWEHSEIQSRKCYEVARKHGKDVVVMEPIKGGSLVNIPPEASQLFEQADPNMSVASWAVRFAASHDGILTVLSGMSNLDQLEDNMSYMKEFKALTTEEKQLIVEATGIINSSIAIPCTACRYCVEGCPQHIAIPEYFALYNAEEQALNKGFSTQGVYYENYIDKHGKASSCIECGQCEKACPQHLAIVEGLKKVAAAFE